MNIYTVNKKIVALVLTGVVALATSGIVYAAGTGSTPKGKPFIEINGQIAEVKGAIGDLQAQHDAISARVDALEGDFQAQIDLLSSEIQRLNSENDLRIVEIQNIATIAEQNGYDIAFALAELQRLQSEIDSLSDDQTVLRDDLQGQIDLLEGDIAANAGGLLGAMADVGQNAELIGFLQSDVNGLQNDLAEKQNDIGADCPAGFVVFGVRDDGTLDCVEAGTSGTPTFISSFSEVVSLDNLDGQIGETCIRILFSWICFPIYGQQSGDKSVSVSCPAGSSMTGGGYLTSIHDDIFVEDSHSDGNGWSVFFDNRNSGPTSGRVGQTFVRCMVTN